MTSTEMLARVRTLLEESSAGFWTDAEVYAALADGQNSVIVPLLTVYKAKMSVDNLTEIPYELASIIVNNDRELYNSEANSYLSATSTSPKAYVAALAGSNYAIHFLPAYSGTGAYTISYVKTPTAIASGQNATLPVSTHNAIVFYAAGFLLNKEEKYQEAQSHFGNYSKELQNLIR